MKKIAGKRKEHSLETSDRKLAERRFKDWAANLDKVDTEAEKTTLAQLVDKFKKTREGLAIKTRKTEQWILGTLEGDWAYPCVADRGPIPVQTKYRQGRYLRAWR